MPQFPCVPTPMTKSTAETRKGTQTKSSGFKADLGSLVAIAAAWVTMVLLVKPVGNFPLNDDWVYGWTVRSLVNEGRLQILAVSTPSFFTQAFWGALFCQPFGFSFNALRLSSLTLGLVGIIGIYFLLRQANVSRKAATLGALAIAVNPLYFELSNTFMTDVPFIALAALASYAFVKGLKCSSNRAVAVGVLISCAAGLIRQIGFVIPLAFGIAYLVKNGLRPRNVAVAAVPPVVTVATTALVPALLGVSHEVPVQIQAAMAYLQVGPLYMALALYDVVVTSLVYLGVFLLPILLVAHRVRWKPQTPLQRTASLLVVAGFPVALAGKLLSDGQWSLLKGQPGDVLIDFGLGPATLIDIFGKNLPHLPTAPAWFWTVVTVAGAIGGTLLVRHLVGATGLLLSRDPDHKIAKPAVTFFLVAMILSLLSVVPLYYLQYFDRYFLISALFAVGLIAYMSPASAKPGRASIIAAGVLIVLYGFFSVCATHDYIDWNRARWRALDHLTNEMQIRPGDIDGGYEFNGWRNYRGPKQNQWHVTNDDYVVAFGLMDGYVEVEKYAFRRWLPAGEGEIFLLRREGLPDSQPKRAPSQR